MLFRTVYGPELKAIYQFVCNASQAVSQAQILAAFVPRSSIGSVTVSTQNVEDALSFLVSSYLLIVHEGNYSSPPLRLPFSLSLLHNLRQIQRGLLAPKHPLDPMFIALLEEIFILPDSLYVDKLHTSVNCLDSIQAFGGVSKEKIQAWKRVMEYLGLGYRLHRGFVCVVAPHLLKELILHMKEDQTTLQVFFEQNVGQFLPCLNRQGDVAQVLRQPMLHAAKRGYIKLTPLQDSPVKAYFHPQGLRQISREHSDAAA
jgi:hypothetical protein